MMWDCENQKARDEITLALHVSEDTCAEHSVFLCEECFDFTIVEDETPE